MSYSAKNVNDTGFIKNFKSGYGMMADDDPEASEALLQNTNNAKQLNNGKAVPDRRSSLKSILSVGSKRKGIVIGIMAFVLFVGIVVIGASLVVFTMLGVQRVHISSLESQLEALRAENGVQRVHISSLESQLDALRAEKNLSKNDTTSPSLQLTTCEMAMQGTQHQLEINAAQCDLEKGNISAKLAAEVRKGEHEKELAQEKLNTCEGSKEELSQRLQFQTRNAEDEKRALGGKVDQCEQEKREMAQRRDEEIRQRVDQCEQEKSEMAQRRDQEIRQRVAAAEAAKSSAVNDGGSSWWPSSWWPSSWSNGAERSSWWPSSWSNGAERSSWWPSSWSNGAERSASPKAVLFFFTMLLQLLFKVLHVV